MKLHKQNPNSDFLLKDITVKIHDNRVLLEREADDKLLTAQINLAKHLCFFGGFRYFAHCPACQQRVTTLHLYKTIFACRRCLKMVYPSQNETLTYRLYKKEKKLKAQLNNDVWTKPKWMRRKTYNHLREQCFEIENLCELAHLLSLRTIHSAKQYERKYGDALGVPIHIVLNSHS